MVKNSNQLLSNIFSFQQEVLDNFNHRVQEIDLFFSLIDKFESVNPSRLISFNDIRSVIREDDLVLSSDKNLETVVRNILQKLNMEELPFQVGNIFKSNAILLLYNLVESTISLTDSFVVKQINAAKLTYQDIAESVKIIWIEQNVKGKNTYKKFRETIKEGLENKIIEIKDGSSEKLFEGNLDARVIDGLLNRYGVLTTEDSDFKHHGKRRCLQKIKDCRNDLAHGKYSFAEFGNRLRYKERNDTENDILFFKESCFEFLEIVLSNVEEFLSRDGFKKHEANKN